jgi:hypothetical protein
VSSQKMTFKDIERITETVLTRSVPPVLGRAESQMQIAALPQLNGNTNSALRALHSLSGCPHEDGQHVFPGSEELVFAEAGDSEIAVRQLRQMLSDRTQFAIDLIAQLEGLQQSYSKKLVLVGELSRKNTALRRDLLGAKVQMQALFISLNKKGKR